MTANFIFETARKFGLTADEQDDKLDRTGFQQLIVAPLGTSVPEDGLLTYVTVDTFKDILNTADNSVILFREDQAELLAILASNADALAVNLRALYGIPSTEYDRWFDSATFNVAKMSYAPTISAIREANVVNDLRVKEQPKSTHQNEVARRTRSDGSTRYHDDDSIGLANES